MRGTQRAAVPAERTTSFTAAVVVAPGFSSLALGAVLEPLTVALAQRSVLGGSIRLYSPDGRSPRGASGLSIEVAGSAADLGRQIRETARPDAVFILTGYPLARGERGWLRPLLRTLQRFQVRSFLMGGAIKELAASGLLRSGAVAIHWKYLDAVGEEHPDVSTATSLYVSDGPFTSCAGGTAVIDMMMAFLTERFGSQVAAALQRHFLYSSPRRGDERQTGSLAAVAARQPEPVRGILNRMIATVEQPLPIKRIAEDAGISLRRVERLFLREIAMSPRQTYLAIRLEKAHALISATRLPLIEVALATGFASVPALSREYRRRYGLAPSVSRRTYL